MPGESLKLFCICSVSNAFLSAGLLPASLRRFKNCLPAGDFANPTTARPSPTTTGATIYALLLN